MHPVADKIKMTSFEGSIDILGQTREVTFFAQDGETKSALTISGLSMEEAWDILSRAHGPVVVSTKTETRSVEQPKPAPTPAKTETKTETKAAAPPSKPAPKVEPPKPEPEPEASTDDVDDDLDETTGGDNGPDVEVMAKADKIRTVIEYLISVGIKTPAEIVAACVRFREKVPALMTIYAKGNFEGRMQRSAEIVLSEGEAKAAQA